MGKKTELVNLPTKMLANELGSGKRYKRIVALGGVGVVVLGVAAYFVVKAADAKEAQALEGAWTDLSACLLGPELADKETPSARFVVVQLGALGLTKDKRGKPGEAPWPTSCAPAAFTLAEHAPAAGEKGAALAESASALAKALKEDATGATDLRAMIDKVWADADASKLKRGASAQGPTAPKAASPVLTPEALAASAKFLSGNFTLANLQPAPSIAPGRAFFLVDQKEATGDAPALCTADATESIRCVKVPGAAAKTSPGLRLVGTIDDRALPFYFAGDRGQLGIFPPNAKDAVASVVAFGAAARPDGSLLLLTRGDAAKDLRLLVAPATGPTIDKPLIPSAEFESATSAALAWDFFVYKGQAKAGAPAHLFAKKLGADGVDPAAATDIGAIEDASQDRSDKETLVAACRSEDATFVRLRGGPSDWIAIYAAGRWAAPVRATTKGGQLTCHGVEAVSTLVTHVVEQDKDFPVVAQARCSSSGCTNVSLNLREVFGSIPEIAPNDANNVAAVDVGGKLLVAWNGGPAGGLRYRVAPADKWKTAEDTVLFDARDASGKQSIVTELKLLPGPGAAILIVGTTLGVRAFKIDASGVAKLVASST